MIILDTNLVAVLMGTSLDRTAADWVAQQDPTSIYITTVTRAEVRYGIARLPHGRRQDMYRQAADRLFASQQDRTLDFDSAAADFYGEIVAERERLGRPIGIVAERERLGRPIGIADAQIAAIARVHDSTVATGDTGGFEFTGVTVVDPFA